MNKSSIRFNKADIIVLNSNFNVWMASLLHILKLEISSLNQMNLNGTRFVALVNTNILHSDLYKENNKAIVLFPMDGVQQDTVRSTTKLLSDP